MITSVVIRNATPDDHNYLCDSMLQVARRSPGFEHVPTDVFFESQRSLVSSLVSRSTVLVAAYSEDPTLILGYICYESPPLGSGALLVHGALVKERYRSKGVFSELLASLPKSVPLLVSAPQTKSAIRFVHNCPRAIFVPTFLATAEGTHPHGTAAAESESPPVSKRLWDSARRCVSRKAGGGV